MTSMATTTRRPRRADATDASVRGAVDRLIAAVDGELDRRRTEARLEPLSEPPVDIAALSSIRRDLPGLVGHGIGAALRLAQVDRSDLRRAVRGGFDILNRQAELAAARRRGEISIDEFGFDAEWTETWLPFFRWVYRHWWRVQVQGVENIPADGRALLVSNHAGVLPYDGAMIRVAIFEEHPARRHARALVLDQLMSMPIASWFVRRTGNTLANGLDAERLLRRDQLVLVFPEGAKGTGKPYRERYRLRRLGRGGFAEIAIRTGAPIVPISVVGSEEIHPMIGNLRTLAAAFGLPYLPVTPTFPWLGPLGVVPLPTSWVITFHAPIAVGDHAAGDPAAVLRLADQVRDVIQEGLYTSLERRGSVFGTSS
jgi:1-acyl-sn-glycerol-3-phosphate acyltransferase